MEPRAVRLGVCLKVLADRRIENLRQSAGTSASMGLAFIREKPFPCMRSCMHKAKSSSSARHPRWDLDMTTALCLDAKLQKGLD